MKFYYLCLSIVPFFISCNESSDLDSLDNSNSTVGKTFQRHNANREPDVMPINSSNPYDIAGQLHNELYEAYYADDSLSTTVADISNRVALIAKENESFVYLSGPNYSFLSNNRVDYILANIDSCISEIIDGSLKDDQAKTSLREFINALIVLWDKEEDYAIIYQFVTAYEDGILANNNLTPWDKKVILTTTSIARHSAYERKKRPKKNTDPDWLLVVGNIVAGTDGSTDSTEKAIMMSLITGIAENK